MRILHMFALIILILYTVAIVGHVYVKQDKKVHAKPVALVQVKDTIYHCQSVSKTNCGYNIRCGDMSMNCVDNITVEFLQ